MAPLDLVLSFLSKTHPLISVYIWLTFFFRKKAVLWQEKLTIKKIRIFLSCTPLLLDLLSIFFTRFFHATAYLAPCGRTVAVLQTHAWGLTSFLVLSILRSLSLKDCMACSWTSLYCEHKEDWEFQSYRKWDNHAGYSPFPGDHPAVASIPPTPQCPAPLRSCQALAGKVFGHVLLMGQKFPCYHLGLIFGCRVSLP